MIDLSAPIPGGREKEERDKAGTYPLPPTHPPTHPPTQTDAKGGEKRVRLDKKSLQTTFFLHSIRPPTHPQNEEEEEEEKSGSDSTEKACKPPCSAASRNKSNGPANNSSVNWANLR